MLMRARSSCGSRSESIRALDRAFKPLTFLVGQCHDDRIFINAKELGRGVVGIAED